MSSLGPAAALPEISGGIDARRLNEIRRAGHPVVMRGLAAEWPSVIASRHSDEAITTYLTRDPVLRPVRAIAAPPSERGRFFYNHDLTGFNFQAATGSLVMFLADLLGAKTMANVPAMAVQSEDIGQLIPRFAAENRLPLLPQIRPRIWIGNRIHVAPHYDVKENIAICVAGRRRFTLFAPNQIENLYPGPLELTPAGTPISMVDLEAPDLDRYPRFSEAWSMAQQAILEPGDAIYIPYCWWHGVQSLDPVNILVNYWWNDAIFEGAGSPYDAMLHAIWALKHLPPDQREVWKGMLDYYVFETAGAAGGHLPDRAKGVLGSPSAGLFARMRTIIRQALG